VAEHQSSSITASDDSWSRDIALDVRHDLRHSASTIMMLVAAIRDAPNRASERAALEGITHCARTIQEMVNELDHRSAAEMVNLSELAEAAVERAAVLYSGTLTVQGEPALVVAHGLDVSRLLNNVIQNACRAAGRDGIVHVTVANEGAWCVLRIADSGPGFTETPAATGTGLGLGLVAGIAVNLKGHVTLGRGPLGGGLVTVHLPREDSAALVPTPSSEREEHT
jgi:signal transduction histidine kinase